MAALHRHPVTVTRVTQPTRRSARASAFPVARLLVLVLVAPVVHVLIGCQSVHTSRADGVPVAFWSSALLAARDGEVEPPEVREMVARVLKEAGLHATVDEGGVSVPEGEERRAREVLLTDKRLSGSNVIVLLAVPAGSGRKSEMGFEVPGTAPDEPMRMPAARPERDAQ